MKGSVKDSGIRVQKKKGKSVERKKKEKNTVKKRSLDGILEFIEDIERKEIKEGKPNFRQYIPLYGPFRAYVDANEGKSSIMNREGHFFRYHLSRLYHFTTIVGFTFGSAWLYCKLQEYFSGD